MEKNDLMKKLKEYDLFLKESIDQAKKDLKLMKGDCEQFNLGTIAQRYENSIENYADVRKELKRKFPGLRKK